MSNDVIMKANELFVVHFSVLRYLNSCKVVAVNDNGIVNCICDRLSKQSDEKKLCYNKSN